MSGIIITGGEDPLVKNAVELMKPDVFFGSCSLPQLPEGRRYHTQTGLTACGGDDYNGGGDYDAIRKSCVTLSGGSWSISHNLVHQRRFHCAWETDSGIMLLGGRQSPNTTELLNDDGGSEERFVLKYPSRYLCCQNYNLGTIIDLIPAGPVLSVRDKR